MNEAEFQQQQRNVLANQKRHAATIIDTPAHRLDITLDRSAHGTSMKLSTFVPHARRPEEQVKFQTTLSDAELIKLQKVLSSAVASATI